MTAIGKPTLKQIKAEARRLGITRPEGGGGDEIVKAAMEHEDPFGYLAIHAPGRKRRQQRLSPVAKSSCRPG
jgi:hypothetical protein